jgi:mono/diheme cytochrome c family protein
MRVIESRAMTSAAIALAVVAGTLGVATSESGKTIWDRVFTAQQAARGEQTYKRSCGYCHRDNLQGDEGPALVGSRFTFQWQDRTLKDLFTTISSTMPDDAPGTLTDDAYVDVISFLLQANGAAAGDQELRADADALAEIRFVDKPRKNDTKARKHENTKQN